LQCQEDAKQRRGGGDVERSAQARRVGEPSERYRSDATDADGKSDHET
jgi:hypothetical protein